MSSSKQTFFWSIAARGIQTSLIVTPPAVVDEEEQGVSLQIFDCDGSEVNRASISSTQQAGCAFELDYLTGLMKLESGMRHGLIAIDYPTTASILVRYQTPQTTTLVPVNGSVSSIKQGLVPVNCNPERRTLLALSNCENNQVQVRGRLMIGKRSPEVTWTLEGMSSRMIEIESSFAAALGEEGYLFSGRGYLRLSTGSLQGVIAHTLVREQKEDNTEQFQIFQG